MSRDKPTAAVDQLIALATEALTPPSEPTAEGGTEATEAERVLGILDTYLAAFEVWQEAVTVENPLGSDSTLSEMEKSALKQKLLELEEVHHLLLSRADGFRHQIQLELSDIRKRSQALRAYIDQFPTRVTIAGKREG